MFQSKARVQSQSRIPLSGVLLLTFVGFLAQGVLAAETDVSYGENELHKDNGFPVLSKRPAFFVGSRYGRSSGAGSGNGGNGNGNGGSSGGMATSKARRLIIVPRNDRFFLGSRYGKRSNEYLSPYEQNSLGLDLAKSTLGNADRSVEAESSNEEPSSRTRPTLMTMSCTYTGISNFYRCSNADDLNSFMNHSKGLPLDANSIAGEEPDNHIK